MTRPSRCIVAIALLALSCADKAKDPREPAGTLVNVLAEPPGAHCAGGGSRVEAGVDDGRGGGIASNGVLERGEVDRVSYVCNCGAADGNPFDVSVEVSAPSNGQFFVPGERPSIAVRLFDPCGNTVSVASASTAQLYVAGPRRGATRTAAKLLNCVTDRQAPDGQHHYVDLVSPRYADPTQENRAITADGLVTYDLAPVSTEAAGTYTAGVWAESEDGTAQKLVLADFQIGTPAVEAGVAGGAGETSTCARCHLGPGSGRMQMTHSFATARSPMGEHALDQAAIAGCELCHNADGYSPNPLVRKVHAVHRGARQTRPGEAHPDYGAGADASLAAYNDVVFTSMPEGEKDCAACHADDGWATAPSRLACGSCHDNVSFDTGAIVPPRTFGKPSGIACTIDADCAASGAFATCDVPTGSCERRSHPAQANDAACTTCHPRVAPGISPVVDRHEILQRTRTRGLRVEQVSLAGGSGPGGVIQLGDTMTVSFRLVTGDGAVVPELKTSSALSATVIVGGPNDDPQRVIGSLAMKSSGTLTWDAATGRYTYAFPAAFPATALPPQNTAGGPARSNAPGTYRLYLYVNEALALGGQSYRDVASTILDFAVGTNEAARSRDLVTQAACDGCHVSVQAHAGSRRAVGGCVTCHTAGSVDRTVGSRGRACTTNAQCPGFAEGWEACTDTNNDAVLDSCVVTADPTPDASIELGTMIHRIHAARRLGGYSTQSSIHVGRLEYLTTLNALADLSSGLSPLDLRNCGACHADTAATCSVSAPCGVGQACELGQCINVSWMAPSSRACLSCHDTGAAAAHAAVETWPGPQGPVETCDVCHGPAGSASVSSAHALNDPLRPPTPRTP